MRTLDLSGSLLSARRIGDTVHAVLADAGLELIQSLAYNPQGLPSCGSTQGVIDAAFAKLLADMDDYVYSIATDVVRVQSLSALGSDVATTPLY